MDPALLDDVEFFKGLPGECLIAVAALGREEAHAEGTEIFQEGDPGDRFYIIRSGSVRISKKVQGAGEEALAVLHPGQHFGEMALIDDHPRSAFAIANEDVALVTIGRNEFQSMLRADKDLAYHILNRFTQTLADRLRQTNDKIQAFMSFSMWG